MLRTYKKYARSDITQQEWGLIISGATKHHVLSLDDIFPFLPSDTPLDDLQKTISKAVEESSSAIKNSKKMKSNGNQS